jgi:ABC-2 type transport system ATP-binding protein
VASAAGIADSRVDEVVEMVGLEAAARRRVVEYSLGMRQRLALAGAMIGDPGVLLLDEPANGLDPEGIAWLRSFLRERAEQGGTVLVSSHVLSEVQQTVDDVVIINNGSLVHAGPLSGLGDFGTGLVIVRSPEIGRLESALSALARSADVPVTISRRPDGSLSVSGLAAERIGHAAFMEGCELHELTAQSQDLERVFLELTGGSA